MIEKVAASGRSLRECVVRGDGHWARNLIHTTSRPTKSSPAFRRGGVYLITGGAQGIGAALATWLAKEQSATLVLLGRSARDSQRIELEQHLKNLGGNALYLSVDIADYTSLRAAVLHAVQQFGPINGVVHSAGVINDGAVQNLTPQMLEQVCAPKIQGTINLYRAVNDQPLDFMLLFSSVMSWLAYAGQANYVAANAFVDGFASIAMQHSAFPVKVINWGHWGETGMASSAYYRERIARMGIQEISTEEGLAAIESILINDWQQLVVMKANESVLEEMGVINHKPATDPTKEAQIFSLPSVDELLDLQSPETNELLINSLGMLIAKAMRMDVQQLLGDKTTFLTLRFTSLGIDSLTTVDLRKRVRDWLGVDVPAEVLIGGALIGEVIDLLKQQILLQRLSQNTDTNSSAEESSREDEEVFML
jgi:NAD(P)-dependent dehydrogenase (short-subunit alcohol dehydrogenase family)/acyl carrier protein